MSDIIRAGVPRHTGATGIAIEGEAQAEAVSFHSRGRHHRIACDTVCLHHGVVPNTQACFVPVRGEWATRRTASSSSVLSAAL